jgi:hypothetical protein
LDGFSGFDLRNIGKRSHGHDKRADDKKKNIATHVGTSDCDAPVSPFDDTYALILNAIVVNRFIARLTYVLRQLRIKAAGHKLFSHHCKRASLSNPGRPATLTLAVLLAYGGPTEYVSAWGKPPRAGKKR